MSEYKFSSIFLLTGYTKFIESKSRKCSICLKLTPRWAPLNCEGVDGEVGMATSSLPVPAAAASFAAAPAASTRHCGSRVYQTHFTHASRNVSGSWLHNNWTIFYTYHIFLFICVNIYVIIIFLVFTPIFSMFTIDIDLNEMTRQNTYLLGQNVITIK